MDNDKLQEYIKKELSYDDEQLNKIYRITVEDSYEDYEPETEIYKDLLAIRLAEQDSKKFNKYFKNANKNDVLNGAYKMTSKEKVGLMLTHGDLFNYNNPFEKTLIDRLIRVIKANGYITPINTKKLHDGDPDELGKLIGNEVNSILVTDAVCAELRSRYNLNFKLFTNSALDKKDYYNNCLKIEDFIRNFYLSNSNNLGGYIDFINKIQINTTVHNKSAIKDNILCQQALLKTLYHEVRHAVMFDKIKKGELDKLEYLIAKNFLYIQKNPIIYQFQHDYFEAEIDAIDFAEKKVREDYKNSRIRILNEPDVTNNRNTKSYDDINNITLNAKDPYLNALAILETMNLDELVKILYQDNNLSHDLKCYLIKMSIKNNKFNDELNLNNQQLNFLRIFLEEIKKEKENILSNITYDPKSNIKYNKEHFTKELDKVDKVFKKL